jgi:hypothetical protein
VGNCPQGNETRKDILRNEDILCSVLARCTGAVSLSGRAIVRVGQPAKDNWEAVYITNRMEIAGID